jgi:hypothetical protein
VEEIDVKDVSDPGPPVFRTIFGVDVEGSTRRTNSAKGDMRSAIYDFVEEALDLNGITEHCRDRFVDRGDGLLVLIHPHDKIPKTLLLNKVVPDLCARLAKYEVDTGDLIRMRAVLHAGEVHHDSNGVFGEAIDLSCRLLDAVELKDLFRQTASPLLLVVSELIHDSIVRHGYPGIDERAFFRVTEVELRERLHTGWAWVTDSENRLVGDTVIDAKDSSVSRPSRWLHRIEPQQRAG